MSELSANTFELSAECKQKALSALIRAIKKKGYDINELISLAETDLMEKFKQGHAITVVNEIHMANGLDGGWFRKEDPSKES